MQRVPRPCMLAILLDRCAENAESDGSEGDSSPLPRRRINRGEEELRQASEREKSKTVADEGKITKSSDGVERKKKADSQPKTTAAEKKAAKTKVRQADRAVIAKQAADLKKQNKKRKQTQEYFAGVCYMCKKEGHIARDCPNPICSNCGEGHHLEHCPQIKCLGCIAYKTKDDEGQLTAQGHWYWNCPYRAERPFCTFCKSKGHEITACTASGCKKASKAAAEREATERAADSVNADLISEDYDPNEPGLGFDPAPRAPGGASEVDINHDAMSEADFEQYLADLAAKEYKSEERKLRIEQALVSAKKEAAANLGKSLKTKRDETTKTLNFKDNEMSESDQDESDAEQPAEKPLSDHESQRRLIVKQGLRMTVQALESPLPPRGVRVQSLGTPGYSAGKPASHWDPKPRKDSRHGKESVDDGWKEDHEAGYDDSEMYCTTCGEEGHMWYDCPLRKDGGADSHSSSGSETSLPLTMLEKEMVALGFKGSLPRVEPFDEDDPDRRACFATEKLSAIPVMLSGPQSLCEVNERGVKAHYLWQKAEVKAVSEVKFQFSASLKEQIALLSSRHKSSASNRKILDMIYAEVSEISSPMSRLLLSAYAGILRVIPDTKETRQTEHTSQLISDIAERRVRELPNSMTLARHVSELVFTHLQGSEESILAADIGPATSALLNLFTAIFAALNQKEQESWRASRAKESFFRLYSYFLWRGTVDTSDELEQQWARDAALREKMPTNLTIAEWYEVYLGNRRRWIENSGGLEIDPVQDPELIWQAKADGTPLTSTGTEEVYSWTRYLRVMNTLSSLQHFKKLKFEVEASSEHKTIKTNPRWGVIKGPFKTMEDVWQRLIAFERKWEEEATLNDSGPITDVKAEIHRAVNTMQVEHCALKRMVEERTANPRERRKVNYIAEKLDQHGKMQETAVLPCLLCGSTDCFLCDWCGEHCSGQGHDRSTCTGATKHAENDTCFRCYKPKWSKNFQKLTSKHQHKPHMCRSCPKRVRIRLRLHEKGHHVLSRTDEPTSAVFRPWHHCAEYRKEGWAAWKDTTAKNKNAKLQGRIEKKNKGKGKGKGKAEGKAGGKGGGKGKGKEGKGKGAGKGDGKGKGKGGKGKEGKGKGPETIALVMPDSWQCINCKNWNLKDCLRCHCFMESKTAKGIGIVIGTRNKGGSGK